MMDAERSARGARYANALERSQTMYIARVQCVSRCTRKIFGVISMTRCKSQAAAPKDQPVRKDLERWSICHRM